LQWFIFGLFSDDPWSNLVQELSQVYAQNLMRSKLVIAILVLALSGANSGAATMCAGYCMSSASVGRAHHHQMESQQSSPNIGRHIHGLHHIANCAKCPPTSGSSLHQKADCASWVQIQALKEGTFSLAAPSEVLQFDAADTPGYAVGLAADSEHSPALATSRTIPSSISASVPLRI
jgi:hypothetical protein